MNRIVTLRLHLDIPAGCAPTLITKTNGVLQHRQQVWNYFRGNGAPGSMARMSSGFSEHFATPHCGNSLK
jgi:hypothetical protein